MNSLLIGIIAVLTLLALSVVGGWVMSLCLREDFENDD